MRAFTVALALATVAAVAAPPRAGAQSGFAPDTFEDSVAHRLCVAARAHWKGLDESVLRYTAVIRQRSATAMRTFLRDRVLYHNETAVRAFWERDHMPVIQVLGTRSEYPGRVIEDEMDWLDDLSFDRPMDPGSDHLLFGIPGQENLPLEPRDDGFWLAHPLGEGADSLYRFRSGDTLTTTFQDGRELRAIQLDVMARKAEANRISGTLWIEPESGALVRAVYRLSREFDAMRDIPDLEREEERGTFRYVPGLLKPWTFDLTVVAVEYSLWDFRTWLPYAMHLKGEAAAGIFRFPVSTDVSYDIESVTLAEDETADPDGNPAATQPVAAPILKEVHFETRAEAMAFIARLLSRGDSVEYEHLGDTMAVVVDNSSVIAPKERHLVAESPHLPPPIWRDADGFPSDAELEELIEQLGDLPAPSVAQAAFGFHWGWARHDLIRYNRVEGPAFGGRLERALARRFSVRGSGFFGLADLSPKVRFDVERSSVPRRVSLGVFHELRPTDPHGRYLDFGNSVNAFLFGRDEGEYYRAAGTDLVWRPPDGARESFAVRVWAERQSAVGNGIDFALFRAFDGDGTFRANLDADRADEAGAELRLSPWWGQDPGGAQLGAELEGRWAVWRAPGEDLRTQYRQAGGTVRAIIPLAGDGWLRWNLGLEAGGGTTWGEAPVQRSRFLGGAGSLRGYSASVLSGPSFWRGRVEVSRTFHAGSAILFGDAGWAGDRNDFEPDDILYGIGVGGSILDGIIRLDLSQGLRGPHRRFRVDLYLDAIL